MVYISKRAGHAIQAWAAMLIVGSVYFELYVRHMQPIYDMLDEIGEYENSFNYLTGWPLFVLTNFYYFLACVQHPGSPEASWVLSTQSIANPSESQLCTHCNLGKPERCSHCKRCKICITKRDHHCDFTNQCVGAGNYKAFFWFTVFTAVSTM